MKIGNNERKNSKEVTKGTRWMPRLMEAMKDVLDCEKLWGDAKQSLIRRYPNGATWQKTSVTAKAGLTLRTETSQYQEEKRTLVIPKVEAIEMGRAQTICVSA